MREEILYEIPGLYRDDFRVRGYFFGSGEETMCIMGSLRGLEYQQLYTCSQLIQQLERLEQKGRIHEGCGILVIPCGNPSSMNLHKRFFSIDNTDVNRMFPGYDLGETTQRIADGIFRVIKNYRYGVQFTSFYMPGNFVPQVRMMKTGLENIELAASFGMPYVVLHDPRPFDTTTLNYNWQIWETQAFSVYTTSTRHIERESSQEAVRAVLRFMAKQGMISYSTEGGYISKVVETGEFLSVRNGHAGFLEALASAGDRVDAGQDLGRITDPYTGKLKEVLKAPDSGVLAFSSTETLVYQHTALFKLIAEKE